MTTNSRYATFRPSPLAMRRVILRFNSHVVIVVEMMTTNSMMLRRSHFAATSG